MVRIKNFKVTGDTVSYNYYCEDKEKQKGSVTYDLKMGKILKLECAPIEIEHEITSYARKTLTCIDMMIKNNKTEHLEIWY